MSICLISFCLYIYVCAPFISVLCQFVYSLLHTPAPPSVRSLALMSGISISCLVTTMPCVPTTPDMQKLDIATKMSYGLITKHMEYCVLVGIGIILILPLHHAQGEKLVVVIQVKTVFPEVANGAAYDSGASPFRFCSAVWLV